MVNVKTIKKIPDKKKVGKSNLSLIRIAKTKANAKKQVKRLDKKDKYRVVKYDVKGGKTRYGVYAK